MPDSFHTSDPQAKQDAAEFLTQYLVSLGGPMKPGGEDGNILLVDHGRKLFQTVGCVACHAAEKGAAAQVPSVPLPNLAEKTTVDRLEAFLLNPLKERPASRMPNLGLSRDEAHALAVYLLRDQLNNPQLAQGEKARLQGVQYEYYERRTNDAAIEHLGRAIPKTKGNVDHFTLDFPEHRNDNFAVKYTGIITIPRNGKYTFFTTSDDGSRLYIDGRQIVENDGVHPAEEKSADVDLEAGDHPITVTYFRAAANGSLKSSGRGRELIDRRFPPMFLYHAGQLAMVPLNSAPYTVDPQKAELGGKMFAALGCASCHKIPNEQSLHTAKSLDVLNLNSDSGCLGTHIEKGLPQYDLNDDQRTAIKATLADKATLNKSLEPKEQVIHTMAAVNCYACHERGGVGGPTADRNQFFTMTAEFDMGDEGKIPPKLNNAGRQAAFDGDGPNNLSGKAAHPSGAGHADADVGQGSLGIAGRCVSTS